eukprot:TRINITY_DN17606_c0_g1_i1.p1 TRINITY_DN17606_c0_g1~~TRINITY_DN17606_c0_g1_i1.p1  ORF type:complete len:134 (+),score=26.67 TRINITY_DN17606_c0_g1_i1:103-504(+)
MSLCVKLLLLIVLASPLFVSAQKCVNQVEYSDNNCTKTTGAHFSYGKCRKVINYYAGNCTSDDDMTIQILCSEDTCDISKCRPFPQAKGCIPKTETAGAYFYSCGPCSAANFGAVVSWMVAVTLIFSAIAQFM